MGYIAFVQNEQVFIYGEEWALNNDKGYKGEGWFFVTQKAVFTDRGKKERKVVILVEKIASMDVVKDILSIYYGTSVGISLMCGKYSRYLKKDIIDDPRLASLRQLNEMLAIPKQMYKDEGMRVFISKITDQIISSVYKEKGIND